MAMVRPEDYNPGRTKSTDYTDPADRKKDSAPTPSSSPFVAPAFRSAGAGDLQKFCPRKPSLGRIRRPEDPGEKRAWQANSIYVDCVL